MEVEIEPTNFDAIILGTGLPESILAGAIAKAGLSVLHIDNSDFYGSHWCSLPLDAFKAWASAGGVIPSPTPEDAANPPQSIPNGTISYERQASEDEEDSSTQTDSSPNESENSTNRSEFHQSETVASQGMYSVPLVEPSVETSMYDHIKYYDFHSASLGPSRSYNIDICGPKLLMCAEELIETLIASGAHNYTEYKPIESTFLYNSTDTEPAFTPVPASRADVFQQPMSLPQKHNLWKFLKQVAQYAEKESFYLTETAQASDRNDSGQSFGFSDLTLEDLDLPFVLFLQKKKLPDLVQNYILYCISLIDNEQHADNPNFVSTKEGLKRMAVYLRSIGRFGSSTQTAFIYPIFGLGEISQAFCRVAAVNGALYVLRYPIKSLLFDSVSKECRGISTKWGQILTSSKIIVGPNFLPKNKRISIPASINATFSENCPDLQLNEDENRADSFKFCHVARFVCIVDRSLVPDRSNILIFVPPMSLDYGNKNVLKILQISSSVKACPENKYVIMISMQMNDGDGDDFDSETVLQPLIRRLFDHFDLENRINSDNNNNNNDSINNNKNDDNNNNSSNGECLLQNYEIRRDVKDDVGEDETGLERKEEAGGEEGRKKEKEEEEEGDEERRSLEEENEGKDMDGERKVFVHKLENEKKESNEKKEDNDNNNDNDKGNDDDDDVDEEEEEEDSNSNNDSDKDKDDGGDESKRMRKESHEHKQLEEEISRNFQLNENLNDNNSNENEGSGRNIRPKMYFCVYFNQKVIIDEEEEESEFDHNLPQGLGICNMPNSDLNFSAALKSVNSTFSRLFPDLQFFPTKNDETDPSNETFSENDPEADILAEAMFSVHTTHEPTPAPSNQESMFSQRQ